MKKKYRIIENMHFNYNGDECFLAYHIQQRKSLLGIKYWKTFKNKFEGFMGSYYEPKIFYKLEDAEVFIKEKLCTGTPINQYKTKVIAEYEC